MRGDIEHARSLADALTHGFTERVEYAISIRQHSPECTNSRPSWAECDCPEVTEQRAKTVRHAPLMAQLMTAVTQRGASPDNGGRLPTRVESASPIDLEALDLVDEIKRTLNGYVRRARQILGYDVPPSSIVRSAVCGHCSGALKLHNGQAVCIGLIGDTPPCGMSYTWQEIEDYLNGQ